MCEEPGSKKSRRVGRKVALEQHTVSEPRATAGCTGVSQCQKGRTATERRGNSKRRDDDDSIQKNKDHNTKRLYIQK